MFKQETNLNCQPIEERLRKMAAADWASLQGTPSAHFADQDEAEVDS